GVVQIGVVQDEMTIFDVRILIEMIDARGIEGGRSSDDPVHLISLGKKQLRQVGAILAGNSGDKRALHHSVPRLVPCAPEPSSFTSSVSRSISFDRRSYS